MTTFERLLRPGRIGTMMRGGVEPDLALVQGDVVVG
jgi:hypothetical protein